MPFNNVSRIYEKGKVHTYLFEVPSIQDDDATQSYILVSTNRAIDIIKITDFDTVFEQISKRTVKPITRDNKEYTRFLSTLNNYLQLWKYKKCIGESLEERISSSDINIIYSHFNEELEKTNIKKGI